VLDEIGCVVGIVIDPADPRIVHVAVEGGFYISTDGGISWGLEVTSDGVPGAISSLALDPAGGISPRFGRGPCRVGRAHEVMRTPW